MIRSVNFFFQINKLYKKKFSSLYYKSAKKQKKYLQKNNFQPKKSENIENKKNLNSENFSEFAENINVSPFANSFNEFKKLKHLLENNKLKKSYRKLYLKEKTNLINDVEIENLEDIKIPFVFEKNGIINFNAIKKNLKKEFLEDINEENILDVLENKILSFFELNNKNKIEKTKKNFERFFFNNFNNIYKLLEEIGLKILFEFDEKDFIKSEYLGNQNYFLINCDVNRKKNLPKILYIEKNTVIDDIDFISIKKKKLEKDPKTRILSRHFIKINLNYNLKILNKEDKVIFNKKEEFDKEHLVVCENLVSTFDYRKFKKNKDDKLFYEKFAENSSYRDLYFIDYDDVMQGNHFFKTFKI